MIPLKGTSLRRIAEAAVDKLFHDLVPAVREDLVTAVVRQWTTCDGHAGIFSVSGDVWLDLDFSEEGLCGVRPDKFPGRAAAILATKNVAAEQVPQILHFLNVRQTADCDSSDGRCLRLRMDPVERQLIVQEVPRQDEEV
jgi:hypothetical protein